MKDQRTNKKRDLLLSDDLRQGYNMDSQEERKRLDLQVQSEATRLRLGRRGAVVRSLKAEDSFIPLDERGI